MFKEFSIEEVFTIKKVYGQPQKTYEAGNTPYVTGAKDNNGVVGFVSADEKSISKGNCISVDPITGLSCYQPVDFVGRGFSGASINLLYNDNLDEKTALFMCAIIEKVASNVAAYTNLFNSTRLATAKMMLPVIENPNPDHEYTVDDIDWQYMRDRITELERDRITELDAYLQATGLNDYELTEEDKKVLSLTSNRASDKNGTLEDNSEDEVRFGEFVMHDIFEPLTVKKAVKANVRNYRDNEFCVPVVYAKFGDNGIMYWGRKDEFTTYSNVLSIVYNGVIAAGKCYAQEDETGILAESYLIRYKNGEVPFLANLYMSKVIEHKIYPLYSRENLAIWNNRVENEIIELPIKSDGTPDFVYMERYIRAMEKVVIADVVKYKDKVIETTKEVVGRI